MKDALNVKKIHLIVFNVNFKEIKMENVFYVKSKKVIILIDQI